MSYSIGKVVHHKHYRGIQDFGKKSCLFGKVTYMYVTALIWAYIPYVIHQRYLHTPRTYIDSN